MSYSSWFDKISIAFLNPLYPAFAVVLKSNPNKLVLLEYADASWLSAPVNTGVHGAIPSLPPWKGTENFNCVFLGPFSPVTSIDALNDFGVNAPASPAHKLELVCPKQLSTLNLPDIFDWAESGKGRIQLALSSSFSGNLHPK